MKIKNIQIENFGNFSNKTFEFNSGINSFLEENGWGKSTLSAFIKAMFYGLDERGRKSKKEIFVERERYLPWNGGKFGGSLVFSYNNKDYRIIRFFDNKKQADDTCKVLDLQTNKETSIFGNDIGLKIFGINKESFERSCFVTLDISKIPELNDDISGKLNNILEDGDDIGNCQVALENISKLITSLDSKSKTAQSVLIKNDINETKEKLLQLDSKEKSIEQNEILLNNAKNDRNQIAKEITILESERNNILLYEQKKIYESLKNNLDDENEKQKKINDFFGGNIPDDVTIGNLKNENTVYIQACTDIENNKITEEQRELYSTLKLFFGTKVPSNDEIENCQSLINKQKELATDLSSKKLTPSEESKLEGLKNQFEGVNISEEIINEQFGYVEKTGKLELEISQTESDKNILEASIKNQNHNIKSKNKTIKLTGIILGTVLFVGGVLGLILNRFPIIFPITFIVLSFISIICSFIIKTKSITTDIDTKLEDFDIKLNKIKEEKVKYKEAYETFIKGIYKSIVIENPTMILSKINSDFMVFTDLLAKENDYYNSLNNNGDIVELKNKITNFTAIYEGKCNTNDVDKILAILRNNKRDFDKLSEKIPKYDEALKLSESSGNKLKECIAQYKTDKTLSYDQQIDEIKNKIIELKNSEEYERTAKNQIDNFVKNHDMDAVEKAEASDKTSDELQDIIKDKKNNEQECITRINSYKEILERIYSDLDERESLENFRDNKEKELKQVNNKVNVLKKTKDLLEAARESLSTKYMGKMETAFSKYLTTIDNDKNITIDNELNVSIEGFGDTYDSKYLSEGYKDIVNFCTRLALVDAMFEDEKPILVLDDPFVNLDKDKIDSALAIVKKIATDKQVIYFTCHNSRSL